jgi:hypothetical protein
VPGTAWLQLAGNVMSAESVVVEVITLLDVVRCEGDLHGWWNDVPPPAERRDLKLSRLTGTGLQ